VAARLAIESAEAYALTPVNHLTSADHVGNASVPTEIFRSLNMSQEAPPIVVDPTEYAAFTVVLRAAIAAIASQNEMLRPGGGQEWINAVSAACQTAILGADISADLPAADIEAFRRKTMEHVNRMLAGLAPQTGAGKPNN
jgi:hypothetical protein